MKRERFEHLIPAEGAHIPVPEDGFVRMRPEGLRVRMSPYWDHLVADGGVSVRATDEAATTEPEPASKASKAR